MTLGWCMESPSGSGQAGIRIQDSFLVVRELPLASALESASLVGLAGGGTTGDMIGITTASFTTTIPTYPTAEFSSITTPSIALADFMVEEDFTAAPLPAVSTAPHRNMDSRHPMPRLAPIPAHSAASIMEESREASPLAGSRASAEVSTEVEAFMAAEAFTGGGGIGKSVSFLRR